MFFNNRKYYAQTEEQFKFMSNDELQESINDDDWDFAGESFLSVFKRSLTDKSLKEETKGHPFAKVIMPVALPFVFLKISSDEKFLKKLMQHELDRRVKENDPNKKYGGEYFDEMDC